MNKQIQKLLHKEIKLPTALEMQNATMKFHNYQIKKELFDVLNNGMGCKNASFVFNKHLNKEIIEELKSIGYLVEELEDCRYKIWIIEPEISDWITGKLL